MIDRPLDQWRHPADRPGVLIETADDNPQPGKVTALLTPVPIAGIVIASVMASMWWLAVMLVKLTTGSAGMTDSFIGPSMTCAALLRFSPLHRWGPCAVGIQCRFYATAADPTTASHQWRTGSKPSYACMARCSRALEDAPVIEQIAISRARENEAAAKSTAICGQPAWLASAPARLRHVSHRIYNVAIARFPATVYMFIVNPLHMQTFDNLFATHPPRCGSKTVAPWG